MIATLLVDGVAVAAPPGATLLVDEGQTDALRARLVVHALEQALSRDTSLSFAPLDQLLPAGDLAELADRANVEAATGREALHQRRSALALESLAEAVSLQQRALPLLLERDGARRHARLLVDLARAHLMAGQQEPAREALHWALLLDPELRFDARQHPRAMRRLFDEVAFRAEALGTGALQVSSDPPGAQVHVGGSFVGRTPLLARGVGGGRNLVTVTRPGYRPRVLPVLVRGGDKPQPLAVKLKASDPGLARLLEQALADDAAALRLATRLKRRLLLRATLKPRGEQVQASLVVLDVRSKRAAARARVTVATGEPDPACRELLDSALAFLAPPPPRPASKRPPPRDWLERARRSPYFWPVVLGAGVVVVGASVGAGVYFGTREQGSSGARVLMMPALPLGR